MRSELGQVLTEPPGRDRATRFIRSEAPYELSLRTKPVDHRPQIQIRIREPLARRLTSMHGLTIRWSLTGAPEGVEDALRAYVEATSHGRYSGRKDLRFKTWRMREGEWFEGCYVFETPGARETFEREFRAAAAGSPSSQIIGSAPVLIEPCEIVAVAEGASGFIESAAFGGSLSSGPIGAG